MEFSSEDIFVLTAGDGPAKLRDDNFSDISFSNELQTPEDELDSALSSQYLLAEHLMAINSLIMSLQNKECREQ